MSLDSIPRPQATRAITIGAGLLVLVAAAGFLAIVLWMRIAGTTDAVARALTRGDPSNGPALIRRYGCGGCHTISAVGGADGQVGPPLDQFRQRVYIAGMVPNTADNLIRWIMSPRSLAPHTAMPATGISEQEARDVAAFLYSH